MLSLLVFEREWFAEAFWARLGQLRCAVRFHLLLGLYFLTYPQHIWTYKTSLHIWMPGLNVRSTIF